MATQNKEKRGAGPKKPEQHNRGLYTYIHRSVLDNFEKGTLLVPEYGDDSQTKFVRARNAVLFAARKFQRFLMNELTAKLDATSLEAGRKSHSDQQKNKAMQSVIESLGMRVPASSEVNKAPNFPFYRGKTKTTAYSRALAGLFFQRHYLDHLELRENSQKRVLTITYSGTRLAWKALHAAVLKHNYDWPVSGGGGNPNFGLSRSRSRSTVSRSATRSKSKSRSKSASASASRAARRSGRLAAKR